MYFTAVLERIIYPPPSNGFRQWTCSIKTQSRCKFGHFVLSSRTYCRVISEIDTGLRRICGLVKSVGIVDDISGIQ
jgi:hypothetical protein